MDFLIPEECPFHFLEIIPKVHFPREHVHPLKFQKKYLGKLYASVCRSQDYL